MRPADIFVPAALQNQIGEAETGALRVRVVAEEANGPTRADGDRVLLERGIHVIPDTLANAGGVTVSYYEWVQNGNNESWELGRVEARLERATKHAYRNVVEFAHEKNCDNRIAAYTLALLRLKQVYAQRRIFP